MSDDILIRILTADDLAPFKALRLEGLRDAPESFGADYTEYTTRPDAFFLQLIGTPPDVVFGAFAGGALVGIAGFIVEKGAKIRHKGFMWGVYVTPGSRRRGIGEALVRRVVDHARRHVEILRSGVVATNAHAADLYRRLGFETYGTEARALRVGARYYDEELIALRF